ncbi:MAG: hypothetical protein Kow0013_07200 [Pararhodobacter sp.]
MLIGAIALYLLAINALTYALFRADKARAIAREWRIPESQLLTAALLGGVLGGRLAMVRFRHKTRKQPFRGLMQAIGLLHFGVAIAGLYLMLAPGAAMQASAFFADALRPAPRFAQTEARTSVVVNRGLH